MDFTMALWKNTLLVRLKLHVQPISQTTSQSIYLKLKVNTSSFLHTDGLMNNTMCQETYIIYQPKTNKNSTMYCDEKKLTTYNCLFTRHKNPQANLKMPSALTVQKRSLKCLYIIPHSRLDRQKPFLQTWLQNSL